MSWIACASSGAPSCILARVKPDVMRVLVADGDFGLGRSDIASMATSMKP